MDGTIIYDYFYGEEAEQFSYYRIPRLLITSPQFKCLSTDAKLLYGLLLDRMGLSAKNGWYDAQGRVFIYYPLEEVMADLNCGHNKAVRLFAELDAAKGVGLIERVKQGLGRPAKIFVKRFTTKAIPPAPEALEDTPPSGAEEPGSADYPKETVQTCQKEPPRLPKTGSQDVSKANASYLNKNYLDKSYLNRSIYPSARAPNRRMDRSECRNTLKQNIGYRQLMEQYDYDEVDAVLELMTDVLCSTHDTVRISGEELPIETVQDRFSQLEQSHIEYVFECLQRNTTEIRNIRAYLLTMLYNAPLTMGHYYQAKVQHDLYGE